MYFNGIVVYTDVIVIEWTKLLEHLVYNSFDVFCRHNIY